MNKRTFVNSAYSDFLIGIKCSHSLSSFFPIANRVPRNFPKLLFRKIPQFLGKTTLVSEITHTCFLGKNHIVSKLLCATIFQLDMIVKTVSQEAKEFYNIMYCVFHCAEGHPPSKTVSTTLLPWICRGHVPVYLFIYMYRLSFPTFSLRGKWVFSGYLQKALIFFVTLRRVPP